MDFLRELEYFIQEQKKKLNADKEFINKSTSPEASKQSPKMVNKACSPIVEYPSRFPDSKVNFPSGTCHSMNAGLRIDEGPLDHPKYGLPGLGEYEERRKYIDKAQKLELNRIYSEHSKPHSAPLDYDEVLAKKREEEMQYRNLNSLGGIGLRAAQSDGFLNRNITEGPAFQRLRPSSLNSSGPVGLQEMGDLSGMKYTELEDDRIPLVSQPDPPILRNSLFSNADPFLSKPLTRRSNISRDPSIFDEAVRQLPPNPRVGIIPNGDSAEDFKRRQKAAYRQDLEMQIQEQKFRKKREKVDQQVAFPGFGSIETGKERKALYQLELERQVEEQRLRRQREKDDFERLERKLLHENQVYDPWGKGGGGAPNRDRKGNVITRRVAAGDREERLVAAIEESPIGEDGRRKIPETWHENHWPLPVDKGPDQGKSTYQEELQRQIQEKKRREQMEKEEQRIEEEKMMQRLEEQRQKMQAEYDAEVRKQRLREEEQRRKADKIVKLQEEQRQEAELRKKLERERRWQQPEKEKEPEKPRSSSPPVPAIHETNKELKQPSPRYSLNTPSVIDIKYSMNSDKKENNTYQLEIPKSNSSWSPLTSPRNNSSRSPLPSPRNNSSRSPLPSPRNNSSRSPLPSPRMNDSKQKSSLRTFADDENSSLLPFENQNPTSLVESLRSPSPPIPALRHKILDPKLPPQRWNSSYIPSIVELKAPAHQRRGAYIAQDELSSNTTSSPIEQNQNNICENTSIIVNTPFKEESKIPIETDKGKNISQMGKCSDSSNDISAPNCTNTTEKSNVSPQWRSSYVPSVMELKAPVRICEERSVPQKSENRRVSESLRPSTPPVLEVRHKNDKVKDHHPHGESNYIPFTDNSSFHINEGIHRTQINKSRQTKDKEDKTHVLSQLSAMRRQLQIEQQQLQQQIHRDEPYIVYDPRLENIRSESALFKPRDKFISKKASQVPFLQKNSPNSIPATRSSFTPFPARNLDENKENVTRHHLTHPESSTACTYDHAFQAQSPCTSADFPTVPAHFPNQIASNLPEKIQQAIDEDYLRVESLTSAIGQRNETARERHRQLALDPFNGLDPEEIASKNRHRLQELERLRNGDIVNRSDVDADSILNSFLNSNSYERS